jgi:hypothetical protein
MSAWSPGGLSLNHRIPPVIVGLAFRSLLMDRPHHFCQIDRQEYDLSMY